LLGVREVAGDDREQRLNPQHYDITRSERGRVGQLLLLPVNPAEDFTVRMEGKLGNQRSAVAQLRKRANDPFDGGVESIEIFQFLVRRGGVLWYPCMKVKETMK